jgi:type III pantothenate kinase
MPDEYGLQIIGLLNHAEKNPEDLTGVCLASVVPPLTGRLLQACRQYLKQNPLVVDAGARWRTSVTRTSLADRIADAAACNGSTVVRPVVDFGTATTFDAISKEEITLEARSLQDRDRFGPFT